VNPIERLQSQLEGRYAVERELGRGGMGAVYLARDVRLDRLVAVKVLPAEYAAQPNLRDRFLRETRMAASFSHPNIVPVYAVEQAADLLAYVMGLIEGESLTERVNRAGPLGARDIVKVLLDVGYALAYAHGRGVVHRDVKPDNIMIERATGRALIMDFGISRAIGPASEGVEGLTRVGEVVGTPEYMSPEQATGDRVDGRSDLYSLGLVAYFAATGTAAMSATTTGKILARQLTETLPPLATVRRDLPAALAAAIDRCVAKDPADRFPTAEALVEALDQAQIAGPEIPVAVRVFAQEAGTLSMILLFGAVVSVMLWQSNEYRAIDNLDALLPQMLLFGVLLTRILQTWREARRLTMAGFTPDEVLRGLRAVVDERAERRAELKSDPATRVARRRTLIAALAQLLAAVVFARVALLYRVQVGPHMYRTALPGVVFIISASVMLGVGLVLLLRSPFRTPVGELLFRWTWVGPLGHRFLRLAARSAPRSSSALPAIARAPAPSAAPDDRVAALEARLAELERRARDR
jgi:serine/threonine-protein kinase